MQDTDTWTLGRRKLGLFLGLSGTLTLASFLVWLIMVEGFEQLKYKIRSNIKSVWRKGRSKAGKGAGPSDQDVEKEPAAGRPHKP